MDDGGIWRESASEVAEVAISYFENLYMTSYPEKILEVVEAVDPKSHRRNEPNAGQAVYKK